MMKKRLERVVVMILSIAMLLSSTGIISSLAANAGESSSALSTTASETETSTSVAQEGGKVTSTTVVEEGGSLVADENGNGTVENPYKISNAVDFLKMTGKINNTTSSNKNFVLTSDIDFSEITEENFKKNGGFLVSVNKSLAKSSENVFFTLDGKGHKIKGLNIASDSTSVLSIFGFVDAKSTIKNLKIEKPCIKSTYPTLANIAVLVAENNGTIKNVEITSPVVTSAVSARAGLVAALNRGTISDVTVKGKYTSSSTVTADSCNLSATGSVGSIAGANSGTVTSVSAINIGMFIPESADGKSVYCGGIVGKNTGVVTNSVSTGCISGGKSTDAAGGIVGKAGEGCRLSNNYTFTAIAKSVPGCGVIGSAGTADMLKDCFWSNTVSRKTTAVTNCGADLNNISTDGFKVVRVGETAKITEADVKAFAWGKAVFSLNGQFKVKGEGLALGSDGKSVEIKETKADTIGTVTFSANVTLPSSVGAGTGSVTVTQYVHIYVLTVPADVAGDGTKDAPLEIKNAAEFNILYNVQDINVKLCKDLKINKAVPVIAGEFDGNGHTLKVKTHLFTTVTGSVKNLNVVVTEDTASAVFTNLYGAEMSEISVAQNDGVKFNANSKTGIFANKIAEATVIDDCRVKGTVVVDSEKVSSVGGFAGVVCGKGTKITNSGAAVDISEKDGKKAASTASFIGSVTADDVEITNCYAAGANTAGKYQFIGTVSAKSVLLKDNYIEKSENKKAASKALDFETYKDFANEAQFRQWNFETDAGFFTGNGGKFGSQLPAIKSVKNSKAEDFKLVYDASKIIASVSVEDGRLTLNVVRANGVVSVNAVPVKVVNTKTGLSATIYVSNGLEKDSAGNWIVASAYDLAYIGENIASLSKASFVMSADVDMSAIKNYTPIGSIADAFSGKFDGKGHTVSNLTINGTAKTALFGTLADAEIKNVKLTDAKVTSEGGYAAVLAGQATGKTVISGITVENSAVKVNDNYAAVIVASVDNADGVKISDITVKNCSVKSNANYVGAVAGRVTDNTTVTDAEVENFKAVGSNYVSGAVGLAQGETAINLNGIKVKSSDISGVSEASGVVSGIGTGASLKNADVADSKIYTVGEGSAFTAGGISAVYGSSMENVAVENTKISAGAAGGVVGRTAADCRLVIKNAAVKSTEIASSGENSVAAGILGVHNVNGTADIIGGKVCEDVTVSGAAVTAGIAGDCSGADSKLNINGTKSFAAVNGSESVNAVAAAGVLGRIGTSAINGVKIDSVKVGGTVSGAGVLGGIIGIVKGGDAYNGKTSVVADTVAYPQINPCDANTKSGMIIGGVESDRIFADGNLDKAIENTVISTYYGTTAAYSAESKLAGGRYADMDKPNGKAITVSVPVLTTAKETEVKINNLPKVSGYKFDGEAGWISESDERIQVVFCTENTAVLKANHQADISVIGYYVLDSDSDVRVPVHFNAVSDIRTPLKGSGTKADPYKVSCAYDLETVAQYDSENAYFVLTDDITFTPADFEFGGAFYNVGNGVVTIGSAESGFKGTFDGNGHKITGLAVSGNTFGGLFGAADGAVISNLVIDKADISGLTYAAVIAGSAKNAVIKNITITSAKVKAVEFGGIAGTVVGYAENTIVENVTIDGAEVNTSSEATNATVETAGGVAGVFDGTIKSVSASGVKVQSGTVAGGVIGTARDAAVTVSKADVNASVNGEIAGGVIGEVKNPLKLSIGTAAVGGEVCGDEISAGVIGKVSADSKAYSLDKAENPIISDTVITAIVADSDVSGAVIGEASAKVFCDKENADTNVFDKVYYSSYQNVMGIFGTEEINSYQNSEYTVNDLSNIKYVAGGAERDYIPLTTDFVTLSDSALKLEGVNGCRTFTVGGKTFKLEGIKSDIDGAVVYDAEKSAIKLASADISEAKAVLVYSDGLEAAIDVVQASALIGHGTQEEPYQISDADDFALLLQNAAEENVYYQLTSDISLAGAGSAELFAGVLDGDGYVLYDYTGSSLFERLTGSVINTGFAGFKVEDSKAAAVGAIAGVVDGGKIEDCFVIADVSANGNNQDAGIAAGRAVNGAVIIGVLTSGKVEGAKALALGGAVGAVNNSKLADITSTAYVNGGRYAGGIVGDAEYAEMNKAIFGGMVESDGKAGNIAGTADASEVKNVYYDTQTSRAAEAGSEISANALSTLKLKALELEGFSSVGGYPVPEALAGAKNGKFAAGTAFASMQINYLAGLNAGSVYNYTTVSAEPEVLGNEVKLDTASGLKLTLVPTADYSDTQNEIARYANPATSGGVNVSCNLVDENGLLGDKLAGILLKSKVGDESDAFSFFTKASDEAKTIGAVVITDGKLYVDTVLPQGVKWSVKAVDENGRELSITDADNEGSLIETGSAKTVVITVKAEKDTEDNWGLRSIWGVIGK